MWSLWELRWNPFINLFVQSHYLKETFCVKLRKAKILDFKYRYSEISGWLKYFYVFLWLYINRTWSVTSDISLPPLYLRHVAPTGAQQWEDRNCGLQPKLGHRPACASFSASLCQLLLAEVLWPWSDWLFTMIRTVAQTFYSGLSTALRETYNQ